MKVLVTGATGFVGQYAVRELLNRGYEVITSSANPTKATDMEWYSQVEYIPLDLRNTDDQSNYFDILGQPDKLIHLAWEGLPDYKKAFHLEENLPRHLRFLTNLIRNGLKDLTVTGTCLEYGLQEGALTETAVTAPVTAYGQAKDQLRVALEQLCVQSGCHFKWARLFYMYGKGQNPNSLLSQLERALANGDTVFKMSGGEQQRDFLPVEEMASRIVDIAMQHTVTGVINCCSGKPVKVVDFVNNYLTRQDKQITLELGFYSYPDYEPMRFWGDTAKLNSIN